MRREKRKERREQREESREKRKQRREEREDTIGLTLRRTGVIIRLAFGHSMLHMSWP